MDPKILKHTWAPKDKLSGFALHLFEMDPRIRVFPFFDEVQDVLGEPFGYLPRKDSILFPIVLPHVNHEIAHMVEMNDLSRVLRPDWGLASAANSEHWKNDTVSPPPFFAAAAREIRVRSIQEFLSTTKSRELHCHPTWGYEIQKRLPFGRFNSMKDFQNWERDLQARTIMAWSIDRIEYEWIRRLRHVQNWMESN